VVEVCPKAGIIAASICTICAGAHASVLGYTTH
jgi:hypothetical protein